MIPDKTRSIADKLVRHAAGERRKARYTRQLAKGLVELRKLQFDAVFVELDEAGRADIWLLSAGDPVCELGSLGLPGDPEDTTAPTLLDDPVWRRLLTRLISKPRHGN